MTSKERVKIVLDHGKPDRVPFFEQGVASNVASDILGRPACTGGGRFRRDGIEAALAGDDAYRDYLVRGATDWGDLVEALDFDVVTLPWFGGGAPCNRIDENTYLFRSDDGTDWSVVRFQPESDTLHTVDSAARQGDLEWLDTRVRALEDAHRARKPITADSYPELQYAIQRFAAKRAIGGGAGIAIPMEPVWLEAIAARPDLIERFLDIQADIGCEAITVQAGMGIDLVWGGGDFVNNAGPLYSPEHFRALMLPRVRRLTETTHRFGLKYIFRTDGNVWPVARYLFQESGVDGYGEIDRQAGMDLGQIRARMPHLILWGNVDCGRTLTAGTLEEVRAETRACIDKAGPGGGYILGSSNVIHSQVPTASFTAMIDECRSYGVY